MLEAIVLGVIQGLTEFIPVSSTAHLVILPDLFEWSGVLNSLAFDVALHFGTTLALISFFWRDWMEILTRNRKMLWFIIAATVPVGIVGLTLKTRIEESLRSLEVIAVMLVVFGIVMLVAEKASARKSLNNSKKLNKLKNLKKMNLRDALIVGIAQVIALVPGVSRSGVTISAGLFAGYRREDAARFSFLLSTPAIVGATLLESRNIIHGFDAEPSLFAAGFAAALVSGYMALEFLMKFLQKHPVTVFVYYRFILAAGIILVLCLRD